MSAPVVLFERDGAIARITLNRPDAGNAINLALTDALQAAALTCDTDPAIRCVVLTGAGRMFCAGGDITAMAEAGDETEAFVSGLARALHLAMGRFARMRKPLVVLVNGHVAGGGYGLALSGDIVLSARSAVFSSAYAMLGATPDAGLSWLLPRLVGLRRAQEIILSNRKLSADEAASLGLITRAVDDDALEEEGMTLARQLAKSATDALGVSRGLLLAAYDNSLETHLELEARGIGAAIAGPEGREGVAAFLAKRAPDFQGVL